MSIFSGLKKSRTSTKPAEAVQCSHRELAPRWDNAADMGKDELIVSFACTSCGQTFSAEEVRQRQEA